MNRNADRPIDPLVPHVYNHNANPIEPDSPRIKSIDQVDVGTVYMYYGQTNVTLPYPVQVTKKCNEWVRIRPYKFVPNTDHGDFPVAPTSLRRVPGSYDPHKEAPEPADKP